MFADPAAHDRTAPHSSLRKIIAALALATGVALAAVPADAVPARALRADDGDRERSVATLVSRRFLDRQRIDPATVRLTNVWVDGRATGHTRWRQMHGGVPVWGGEGIIHTRGNAVYDVTDAFVPGLQVSTQPQVQVATARATALASLTCMTCTNARVVASDLWVARFDGVDRLTWRVTLVADAGGHGHGPEQRVVFVDAHDGNVVHAYDNLHTGTGPSLYRGTVTVPTLAVGSTRYMEDTTRRIGVFDMRNGTGTGFRFSDADDVWNATAQRAAVDAQFGSAAVMDYLRVVHGRNGINGANGPGAATAATGTTTLQTVLVHFDRNYNNAFWDGQKVVLGDGDGTTFGPLVALDILAHEWFHGLTQFTAGLIYSNESGALNESFSDVFAALVERRVEGENAGTWMIGEDAYTPGTPGDALRYLNDPRRAANFGFTANDQPDHYAERYTGTQDNGGVHINSGIPNHAFYLLAVGGTHRRGGSLAGIGADAAGRIWYRALTTYLTSSSNFAAARTATTRAATDLFGATSYHVLAVQNAWCLVGVGACVTAPQLLVNGGFERTRSPWVASGTGITYTATGGTPFAGTGSIVLGGSANANGMIYQEIALPANSRPMLTLQVGVVSADTSTVANDRLFVEVRDASGTVRATPLTLSNLQRTANGAYALRGTFPLAGFAGSRVRITLRVATNATLNTSFRIDEVSVR